MTSYLVNVSVFIGYAGNPITFRVVFLILGQFGYGMKIRPIIPMKMRRLTLEVNFNVKSDFKFQSEPLTFRIDLELDLDCRSTHFHRFNGATVVI